MSVAEHDPRPAEMGDDDQELLEAGMAKAFASEETAPAAQGHSVLAALRDSTGVDLSLLLQTPSGASAELPPVVPGAAEHRYRVLEEVGKGGMGLVLKGHDADLGRMVAIKVLRERHAQDPAMLRRFVEEARIGGQLEHPGIVPIYDVGLQPDRRPFFTMKLVEGRTLAEVIHESQDLGRDRPRLLGIFEQVCRAMAYAHARGVVHRDLKPANVMVGAYGEVLVMDWGLAKLRGHEAPPVATPPAAGSGSSSGSGTPGTSQAGSVLGTPAYMPPEQARADLAAVDERSDVFSLGGILCEILTGKPPYVGTSVGEILRLARQGSTEAAFERLAASGAEPDLAAIARDCLAAEPAARPPHAGELADRVTRYLHSVQEQLESARLAQATAEARAESEQRARRLTVGLAASVLALLTLAGGGWLWLESQARSRGAAVALDVDRALQEARSLEGVARGTAPPELGRWDLALAASDKAAALAAQPDADAATRARAASARATIAEGREATRQLLEQRERDRQMLARLDQVRAGWEEHLSAPEKAADYQAAFVAYGVDVMAGDEAATLARLRTSEIAVPLAQALDGWADVRLTYRLGDAERLQRLAIEIDPDPWRQRVRRADHANDGKALDEMVAAPELWQQSPLTLYLVIDALGHRATINSKTPQHDPRAIELYRRALLLHPGDYWLNFGLADSALQDSRFDESLAAAQAALAVRPQAAEAWCVLASVQAVRGQLDQAQVVAERALQAHPENARVLKTLAAIHGEKGDRQTELRLIDQAIALRPRVPALHFHRADVLRALDRTEDAIAAYKQAIDYDPTWVYPMLSLANTLFHSGQVDEAVTWYRKTVQTFPDFAEALSAFGNALRAIGRREEAARYLRRAVQLHPDHAGAHHNLALVLIELGHRQEAIAELRQARELDPQQPETRYWLALMTMDRAEIGRIVEEYRAAAAAKPDLAEPWFKIARALTELGDLPGAIAAYREHLKLAPNAGSMWSNLGLQLEGVGDYQAALAAFEKAAALSPDDAKPQRFMARAMARLGRTEEAIERLQRMIDAQPADVAALTELAAVHWLRGDRAAALATYETALEVGQPTIDLLCEAGEVLYQLGDCARAIELLEQAIGIDATQGRAHFLLGNAHLVRHEIDPAIAAFEEGVRLLPNLHDAHIDLAFGLQEAGRFDEAVAAFRKGKELGAKDPQWKHPVDDWIAECAQMGKLLSQLEALQRGEGVPAKGPELLLVARTCLARGVSPAAARFFTQAFTADPSLARGPMLLDAAAAAALAAASKDSGLTDDERRALRAQALRWLDAHGGEAVRARETGGDRGRWQALRTLRLMLQDARLASLREAEALAALSEPDRAACEQLWQAVRVFEARCAKEPK